MGVLNTTPDSFSDGGVFADHDAAVAAGLAMWDDGADFVDVGGESTRPGSDGVDAATELDRVLPVVAALAARGVAVSIDTSKAEVAAAALRAGAVVVNDVTAFSDPEMAPLAAANGCGVVLMHMLGEPRTMQQDPSYDDVVRDVHDHLTARARAVAAAGVDPSHIALDPGIGFGKTVDHNLRLLSEGVRMLAATGHPVLVGASRKSFLGSITGEAVAAERQPETIAAHALAIASGATIVRTHDVVGGLRSSLVAAAIVRGVVEQ